MKTVLNLCGGINLHRVAFPNSVTFYSADIDGQAGVVSEAICPEIIQLGDVMNWQSWAIDWSQIDLVICNIHKREWVPHAPETEHDGRFHAMLDIINHAQSEYVIIRPVLSRPVFDEYVLDCIEEKLGFGYETEIDGGNVSAMHDHRSYVSSFPIEQPEEIPVTVGGVLEGAVSRRYSLVKKTVSGFRKSIKKSNVIELDGKAAAFHGKRYSGTPYVELNIDREPVTKGTPGFDWRRKYRMLTPRELMRCRSMPEYYVWVLMRLKLNDSQWNRLLGQCGTLNVFVSILRNWYEK